MDFFDEARQAQNSKIGTQLKKNFDNGFSFKRTSASRKKIWVSQSYCPRQAKLDAEYSGISSVKPISSMFMKMGVLTEDIVMQNLSDLGAVIYPLNKQFYVSDVSEGLQDRFSGKIDGILNLEYENKNNLYALEVKTCGKLPSKPKPEHINQLFIYAGVTGLKPILMYFSRYIADWRNELINQFHVFDYDKALITKEMSKLFYAMNCVEQNLTPNIVDVKKTYCNYCNHKQDCRVDEIFEEIDPSVYAMSVTMAVEYMRKENLEVRFEKTIDEIYSKNKKAKSILKNIDKSHLL